MTAVSASPVFIHNGGAHRETEQWELCWYDDSGTYDHILGGKTLQSEQNSLKIIEQSLAEVNLQETLECG